MTMATAAISAPRAGQPARLRHRAAARLRAITERVAAPVRQPAANLARIPLTVAGLGCVDAAAFVGCTIAGLVVTGASLIALEFLIADED